MPYAYSPLLPSGPPPKNLNNLRPSPRQVIVTTARPKTPIPTFRVHYHQSIIQHGGTPSPQEESSISQVQHYQHIQSPTKVSRNASTSSMIHTEPFIPFSRLFPLTPSLPTSLRTTRTRYELIWTARSAHAHNEPRLYTRAARACTGKPRHVIINPRK
jgi:hypothetical protein